MMSHEIRSDAEVPNDTSAHSHTSLAPLAMISAASVITLAWCGFLGWLLYVAVENIFG
jgi:hypothetical protein